MNKRKCLIISASPRRHGNSEVLCQQFARGAQEQGVDVEIIHLNAYQIAPCIACEYCRHHDNQCFRQDDANQIIQKMIDADIWVLSTPVYFYSVSAQLKLLIDRIFAREYEIKNHQKEKMLISSSQVVHQITSKWLAQLKVYEGLSVFYVLLMKKELFMAQVLFK